MKTGSLIRQTVNKGACIIVMLAVFCGISSAQYGSSPSPPVQLQAQPVPKNLLKLEELNALDAKFHKDLDTAQEAFDGEKFTEAEQGFSQLSTEIEGTLKRIATATLTKGVLEIDGVRKPATVENETAWFSRTLEKAKQKKSASSVMRSVSDVQKQANDLLSAGKYPEDVDAYRKSAQLLETNRAQLDEATFQFFLKRAANGEVQANASYWGKEFQRLKDTYNKSTDDKLATEEVRRIIQSVADEIAAKGYLDATKNPEMPEDARSLFHTLADAAHQYLDQK